MVNTEKKKFTDKSEENYWYMYLELWGLQG